jgi:hypothetical protein
VVLLLLIALGIGAIALAADQSTTLPAKNTTSQAALPEPRTRPATGPSTEREMALAWQRIEARRQSLDADFYAPASVQSIDQVTHKDGRKFTGKILDYGTRLAVVTKQGRFLFNRDDLTEVEPKKRPDEQVKPNLADVDVLFIERTPRMRSNHGNVEYKEGLPRLREANGDGLFPAEGTEVTYTAHVANKGRCPRDRWSSSGLTTTGR